MEMEEKLTWKHNEHKLVPSIKEEPVPSIQQEMGLRNKEEPVAPIEGEPLSSIKEEMVFLIKEEPEWLTEELHTQLYPNTVDQEYKSQIDDLLSIKTELPCDTETQQFCVDAKPIAVQPYSPIPQTHEFIKTELVLDDQFSVAMKPESCARENEQSVLNTVDENCGITIAGDEWEVCSICYKLYPKELIEAHRSEAHPGSTFQCEVCQRCFTRKTSLLRHRNIHTETHEFVCGECPRAFADRISLKGHQLTHAQDRVPELCCTLCKKKFLSKHGLQGHMKVHTSPLHNCEHCALRFKSEQNLKTHVILFHAVKQPCSCEPPPSLRYKCDLCDKTYASTKSLSVHSKEHDGFPWKCRMCAKKFHVLSRIRGHIRKVHKIFDKETILKIEERISIT